MDNSNLKDSSGNYIQCEPPLGGCQGYCTFCGTRYADGHVDVQFCGGLRPTDAQRAEMKKANEH